MLVIKGGSILTMAAKNFENGTIIIENGIIKRVGSDIKEFEYENADEIIDASGMIITPGLTDAHFELDFRKCDKDISNNSTIKAIDSINLTDPVFKSALSCGITSVMLMPNSSNIIGGESAFIKLSVDEADKMIVLSPAGIKLNLCSKQDPYFTMNSASVLRKELFHASLYKLAKDKALSSQQDFKKDFYLESYLPVLNGSIPLQADADNVADILSSIRIAKEYGVFLTINSALESVLVVDQIVKSGNPCVLNQSLAFNGHYFPNTPTILNKAGIIIALSSMHPLTSVKYLRLCAAIAAKEGLGEYAAMKAITINAAKICRVSHRVGSIEEGKDADIAIFNGNPLDVLNKTVYTIVNGKIVYKNL